MEGRASIVGIDAGNTAEPSPDLFGDSPVRLARHPMTRHREPPELKAARALSAQLRHKRNRREKRQVAHLICLNLISMLRHGARR
jgi:hypothetical protein